MPADTAAEITCEALKRRLDAGEKVSLLDVREPAEYARVNLGGRLIPLGELPARLGELDPASELVVHCRSGSRSARAVALLRQRGFTRVRNLVGGLQEWRRRIDPTLPAD